MKVSSKKVATPVMFNVIVEKDELFERKKKAYDLVKDTLELKGFRKGHISQDIAEEKLGVERLYKPMIDDVYHQVALEQNIVSAWDFKFYGDLKKSDFFEIRFKADVKPEVETVSLDVIKEKVKLEPFTVSDEDIKKAVEHELKKSETIEDSTKEVLDSLDVAIIDFEGKIAGEQKPFNGGTAKGYQITVNEIVNGRKSFIDGFEEQLVGMKIGETKEVKVKFPQDYRETSLADKDAVFVVTLNKIKIKKTVEYNTEFTKTKGFDTIKEYEESLKKNMLEENEKNAIADFKKKVVTETVNCCKISPIPEEMIKKENEKEWFSFLRRIDKTEEKFLSENKHAKLHFYENNSPRSLEIIKAMLVLEKISQENEIKATEEEVVQYVMRVSNILMNDPDRAEKIKEDLKENVQQYKIMEIAANNEKTVEFLSEKLK